LKPNVEARRLDALHHSVTDDNPTPQQSGETSEPAQLKERSVLSPIAPPGIAFPNFAFILYPLQSLRSPAAIRSLVGFAGWNLIPDQPAGSVSSCPAKPDPRVEPRYLLDQKLATDQWYTAPVTELLRYGSNPKPTPIKPNFALFRAQVIDIV
jgi:hypothetical protein